MTQRITHSQRLNLAESGSISDLSRLVHTTNSEIIGKMLANPNMTSGLVVQLIRKKSINETHIITVSSNKKWMKDYRIKLELILYPVTPRNITIKLLQDMMIRDLAVIAKKVTLHPILRETAVNYLKLRLENIRLGEKITLAKTGPPGFLPVLMAEKDSRIFKAALTNFRLAEQELLQFLAPSTCSSNKLEMVMSDEKWGRNPQVMRLLAHHNNLGYASRRRVFEKITLPLLMDLTDSPVLNPNHQNLASFVAKQRVQSFSKSDLIQLAGSPSKKLLYFIGITMTDPQVALVWMKNRHVDKNLMEIARVKNSSSKIRNLIGNAIDNPNAQKGEMHDQQ